MSKMSRIRIEPKSNCLAQHNHVPLTTRLSSFEANGMDFEQGETFKRERTLIKKTRKDDNRLLKSELNGGIYDVQVLGDR